MTTVNLRLLGDFEALDGTGHLVDVSAKKSRALLAILALSPSGSMSRPRLANLMWSDRGDEQARSSLRQALASLRRDFAAIDAALLSADGIVNLAHRGRKAISRHLILMLLRWLPPMSPWPRF